MTLRAEAVKYFFLSDGWVIGRIWEFGGLWNENVWRRRPNIQRTRLYILEKNEQLWLYQVEEAVLMLEVKPIEPTAEQIIGQVVLKRLMSAEQTISYLDNADEIFRAS